MGRPPEKESTWLTELTPHQCRKIGEWVFETIREQLLDCFEVRDVEAGHKLVQTTVIEMLSLLSDRKFHTDKMDPRLFRVFLIELRHTKDQIETELRVCREEYGRWLGRDGRERHSSTQKKSALEHVQTVVLGKMRILNRVVEWGEKEGFSLRYILEARESAPIAHEFLAWRFGRSVKDISELLTLDRKQTEVLVANAKGREPTLVPDNIVSGRRDRRVIENSVELWRRGYFEKKPEDIEGLDPDGLIRFFGGYCGPAQLTTMGPIGASHLNKPSETVVIGSSDSQ